MHIIVNFVSSGREPMDNTTQISNTCCDEFSLANIKTCFRLQSLFNTDMVQLLLIHPGEYADVIKWKHFPRYEPFVMGIHLSPVESPHKGQWRGALMFFCDLRLNKLLRKQSKRRWFETPSRPLWRLPNSYCVFFRSLNFHRCFTHKRHRALSNRG